MPGAGRQRCLREIHSKRPKSLRIPKNRAMLCSDGQVEQLTLKVARVGDDDGARGLEEIERGRHGLSLRLSGEIDSGLSNARPYIFPANPWGPIGLRPRTAAAPENSQECTQSIVQGLQHSRATIQAISLLGGHGRRWRARKDPRIPLRSPPRGPAPPALPG